MFRREQRGGDAQDGTAGDGPGCEPSGEPGGEEGAGERGGGGGGGWDSGEGSGRSDAVVVERGSRHNPGAGSGSMAKATAPSWDQAGEAGTASPARLVLLASATACKHDGVRVRLGCFTNLHRLSARGPVPKVMLKLELQRWPRTSDACGPAP
jgi:hypothetical protein